MSRKTTLVTVVILLVLHTAPALADSAMTAVQKQVGDLLTILRSRTDDVQKEASIRNLANRFFDFNTLSRLTLGRNWRKLDAKQQETFTELYRKLLENVYINKLLQYTDQKVVYDRELPLTDTMAEVQSRLISENSEIPISYKMIKSDDSWKIYDLVIENVSLVQNYRSQFTGILRDKSPGEMLEILRKKIQSTKD